MRRQPRPIRAAPPSTISAYLLYSHIFPHWVRMRLLLQLSRYLYRGESDWVFLLFYLGTLDGLHSPGSARMSSVAYRGVTPVR